jgi:hypothetical protein
MRQVSIMTSPRGWMDSVHVVGEHMCENSGGKMDAQAAEEEQAAGSRLACMALAAEADAQEWHPAEVLYEGSEEVALS